MKYAVALVACLSAVPAGAQSLCAPDETTIFTCAAKPKIVSVCASKDVGPRRGYVQFRIGFKRRNATSYPPDGPSEHNAVTYGDADLGQGPPGRYIMLKDGHNIYAIVSTGDHGPQYGSVETAFVRQRDRKLLESAICDRLTSLDAGIEILGNAGFPDVYTTEPIRP